MRVGLALGSNLGDRLANLRAARSSLIALPIASGPVLSSSLYETEPVGCEPGAAKFLNAVLEIGCASDAKELLGELHAIQQRLGRPDSHRRNQSRTIDIDILYVGDTQLDAPELQLPHPRLHQRRFVLAPLAEIRPDLVLPNQTCTIAELLAKLEDPARVVPLPNEW